MFGSLSLRAFARWVALTAIVVLSHVGAQAAVLLQLQRLSDTDALLIGQGSLTTLDAATSNRHMLRLIDPFGVRPGHLVNSWLYMSGNLKADAFEFNFAHDVGTGFGDAFENLIYIGRNTFQDIPANSTLSGSILLHLGDGATFAPVGATGDVYWGTWPGALSGSWEMVAATPVPEPQTVALFSAGLLALVFVTRSRRAKSR